MIVLDTTILVAALTGPRSALPALTHAFERFARVIVPTLVLYEWFRGPRQESELAFQEELLPVADALEFGAEEAAEAGRLYRSVSNPRRRQVDIGIAAHALIHGAPLWTLNERDFADIPGLLLYVPR